MGCLPSGFRAEPRARQQCKDLGINGRLAKTIAAWALEQPKVSSSMVSLLRGHPVFSGFEEIGFSGTTKIKTCENCNPSAKLLVQVRI